MNNANANAIAVEELRVGMFVQLEGGWLAHPFPLSAFKLSTAEQIETLRRLGLREVRWIPEKSDLQPPTAAEGLAGKTSQVGVGVEVGGESGRAEPHGRVPAAETMVAQRARLLQQQREAAQHCQRQHDEVESALRQVLGSVAAHPREAGRASTALAQSMLEKMLDEDEVGIRLITSGTDREISHAMNVSVVSLLIGRRLGMLETDLLDLGVGALMHDAGKQEIALRYRHLSDGQTAHEVQAYREHVNRGVRLGRLMSLTPGALAVVAQHHEQADGGGFPKGLAGEQISLAARVVSIVNRYDGLCNPRGGAPALTPHEAVATLFAQHRHRFDGTVLNAFIRMMGVYPAGSIVQLTDDRFALVVGANSSRPLKPRVLVYDPKVSSVNALLLDLELERDLGIRRSLTAQRLPADALHYLNPRPRVSYYFEPLEAERGAGAPAR
jgi:HD-GYP domain-containing protein (c-di-GMP phosphodiesterase class II)